MMRIYRGFPGCYKCVVQVKPLPEKTKRKLQDVNYSPLEDLLNIPALLVDNVVYRNLLKNHLSANNEKRENIGFTFQIEKIQVCGAGALSVNDLKPVEIYKFHPDEDFLSDLPKTALDATLRVHHGLLKNNTLYANVHAGMVPAFPTEPLENKLNEKIGVNIESLEKDGKSILLEGNLTAYERPPNEFGEDGVSFFGNTRYI